MDLVVVTNDTMTTPAATASLDDGNTIEIKESTHDDETTTAMDKTTNLTLTTTATDKMTNPQLSTTEKVRSSSKSGLYYMTSYSSSYCISNHTSAGAQLQHYI